MTWRSLIPIGLVAFIVGLVLYLPASLVAGWVQVPGLAMAGISGTALDGHVKQARYQGTVVDNIGWQLHPASLLTGHLGATITVSTGSGHFQADVSTGPTGATHVQDIQGRAPLRELAQLAGYNFVPIRGTLVITDGMVTIDAAQIPLTASAQLQLRNTQWTLIQPPLALGDFTAKLTSAEGKTTLNILDSSGPLALKGQATITNNSVYSLNVRLRARAGADKRLKTMLQRLGKPDNQGWYHIQLRGRL